MIAIISDIGRTTMSYARYLMSVHLGRYLLPDEHVDHIDNNKLNDTVDNLQIMSQADNTRKSALTGESLVKLICPHCGSNFKRRRGNTNLVYSRRYKLTFCSRSCAGKYYAIQRSNQLS